MNWYCKKFPWPSPKQIAHFIKENLNSFWFDSNLEKHSLNQYSILSYGTEKIFTDQEQLAKAYQENLNLKKHYSEPLGFYGLIFYPDTNQNKAHHKIFFILAKIVLILNHQTKEAKVFYQEKNSKVFEEFSKKILKKSLAINACPHLAWQNDMNFEEFKNHINIIKNDIQAGTVYQINYSQRFQSKIDKNLIDSYYLKLRQKSPSQFSAFININHDFILCNSPECFLKIENQKIHSFPIKGTRKRSTHHTKDKILKKELFNSEKDQAELLMIVDLMRNDLGKSCEPGTIKVEEFKKIETYNNVHHLVSKISGKLKKATSSFETIFLCFPAGSITGAPKIKSMELIQKYEETPRNIYTGSIGYLAFNGSANFNVAIRTAYTQENILYTHSGAGIVSDSQAKLEYEEIIHKVKNFLSL